MSEVGASHGPESIGRVLFGGEWTPAARWQNGDITTWREDDAVVWPLPPDVAATYERCP